MGRRGTLLVPADRLLVLQFRIRLQRTQGVYNQPGRRCRFHPGNSHYSWRARGAWSLDAFVRRDEGACRPAATGRRYCRAAALPGCYRQVRASPALRVAARRDGRPDSGERSHPCRHHGDGGRLHDRAAQLSLPAGARRDAGRCDNRRAHVVLRGDRRDRPIRYQARARVFDDKPDRLHGGGCRRGSICRGNLPPDDACVLQGAALPLRRLDYACARG